MLRCHGIPVRYIIFMCWWCWTSIGIFRPSVQQNSFEIFCRQSWLVANSVHTGYTEKTVFSCPCRRCELGSCSLTSLAKIQPHLYKVLVRLSEATTAWYRSSGQNGVGVCRVISVQPVTVAVYGRQQPRQRLLKLMMMARAPPDKRRHRRISACSCWLVVLGKYATSIISECEWCRH